MMLMLALTVPPVLVPVMVNIVRLKISVGVPLISPLVVSKARPAGRLGLMAQERISPSPSTVGESGRSLLAVLLTKVTSSGE